jgi:pilus assembly protein Flp/PilA
MLDYTRTWLAVRGITLFNDKRGVTALEYGMIAALIAAVIIGTVSTIGNQLENAFKNVSTNL